MCLKKLFSIFTEPLQTSSHKEESQEGNTTQPFWFKILKLYLNLLRFVQLVSNQPSGSAGTREADIETFIHHYLMMSGQINALVWIVPHCLDLGLRNKNEQWS